MSLADIETEIQGIPAIVRVTDWEPYVEGKFHGPPDSCYPAEGGWGEWEILDRRGRPAPWLEEKLTTAERELIDELVFDRMESDES